ncbi:hypothetical protein LMJ53_16785 [Rheinheimera sp. UJ51]|uniref:hypothetical protein n=1 Tax=Rheinheimera sp. UJ51 TaxID=2892446 RepID=UPI001E5FD06C|nr:hypothetical protein [Rheinheimera sp. UJ51]MCC5453373.1 hypothetical protein [Rheinheimera sp. UJ51]
MRAREASSAFALWVFAAFAITGVAAVCLFYGYHFTTLTEDHKVWAEFGSFFGGVVTPFLAFFSFLALIYTIHIQKRELELTREELTLSRAEVQRSANSMEAQERNMRLQQFENTFFSMLQMLNSLYDKVYPDLTLLETKVTQERPDLTTLSVSALQSDHAVGHYFELISRIIEHIQSNAHLIVPNSYYRTLRSVLPDRVFIIYCAKFVDVDIAKGSAVFLRKAGFFSDSIEFQHEHLTKLYKEFLALVDC